MKKVLLAFVDHLVPGARWDGARPDARGRAGRAAAPAARRRRAAAPTPITDADIKGVADAEAGGQGRGRPGRHADRHGRRTFPSATRRRA